MILVTIIGAVIAGLLPLLFVGSFRRLYKQAIKADTALLFMRQSQIRTQLERESTPEAKPHPLPDELQLTV